jgi:FixJ family two-component response regulator
MNSILIVDDEQGMRDMLAKLLSSHGYKTSLAADGQTALRKIAKERPAIVLLDLVLPGMNGMTVLEQIREINPDINIIIMTGFGDVKNAVQAMKLGAYDFIAKPFAMDELLIILERAGDNIKLRREQATFKAAHAKYFNLYDQAPTGYLTLSEQGLILEANLTAAKLLGVDKRGLVNQPLTRYIVRDDQAIFEQHRQQLFETHSTLRPSSVQAGQADAPQMCDLLMARNDSTPFFAHLEFIAAQNGADAPTCWIMLSDFTEHRQLEKLREEQRYLRQLAAVTRELHDGLGGLAANTGILAELGRRQAMREEDKKIFLNIAALADEMNSEVHGLMNTLESRDIHWSDWVAECRQHGTTLMATHGMAFDLRVTGDLDIPGPQLWPYVSLTRIFKEALTNIIKHSGANRVQVVLQFNPDRFSMEIDDNGRGFAADNAPGRGLVNMRTRAMELGGTLSIRTQGSANLQFEFPIPLRWVEKEIAEPA